MDSLHEGDAEIHPRFVTSVCLGVIAISWLGPSTLNGTELAESRLGAKEVPSDPRRRGEPGSREILYFDDPSADLLETDRDKLEGKPPLPRLATGSFMLLNLAAYPDGQYHLLKATLTTSGQYRAVRVSFSLRSSSYATMLLRELMKQESSTDVQRRLYTAAQQERQTDESSAQAAG